MADPWGDRLGTTGWETEALGLTILTLGASATMVHHAHLCLLTLGKPRSSPAKKTVTSSRNLLVPFSLCFLYSRSPPCSEAALGMSCPLSLIYFLTLLSLQPLLSASVFLTDFSCAQVLPVLKTVQRPLNHFPPSFPDIMDKLLSKVASSPSPPS